MHKALNIFQKSNELPHYSTIYSGIKPNKELSLEFEEVNKVELVDQNELA
jgi:hypothetical protein